MTPSSSGAQLVSRSAAKGSRSPPPIPGCAALQEADGPPPETAWRRLRTPARTAGPPAMAPGRPRRYGRRGRITHGRRRAPVPSRSTARTAKQAANPRRARPPSRARRLEGPARHGGRMGRARADSRAKPQNPGPCPSRSRCSRTRTKDGQSKCPPPPDHCAPCRRTRARPAFERSSKRRPSATAAAAPTWPRPALCR